MNKMKESITTKGEIKRSRRAVAQDRSLAMGSDVLNAIIELVTNSDDAYQRMTEESYKKHRITIDITSRFGKQEYGLIQVKDNAKSMTKEQAEKRLGVEGGRNSGFEKGENTRGLLGRGAKDVVHFGPTQWYLRTPNGDCTIFKHLYESDSINNYEVSEMAYDDPEFLKVKSELKPYGTIAEIKVLKSFTVPTPKTLYKKLSQHISMQKLLEDREVRLIGRNSKGEITYDETIMCHEPARRQIAKDLRISMEGYPEEEITINLYELDESVASELELDHGKYSLRIQSGRGSFQMYEEKAFSPYLYQLSGYVDVPGINNLQREYDDRYEREENSIEENPIALIKRDRSGLEPTHPFTVALNKTLKKFLEPHIERLRNNSKGTNFINETSQEYSKTLGRIAGQILAEADEEVDGVAGSGGKLPPIGLSTIPSSLTVEPLKKARITVRFREDPQKLLTGVQLANVKGSLDVDIKINNEQSQPFSLTKKEGYFSGSFNAGERKDGEIVEVTVSYTNYDMANSIIEWTEKYVPPIDKLSFEHDSYSLKEGVSRSIKLLFPWSLADDSKPEITISDSSNISIIENTKFQQDYSKKGQDCAYVEIVVLGNGIGSKGKLKATLKDQTATASITVKKSGTQDMAIIFGPNGVGAPRILFDRQESTITVNTKDKSIKKYMATDAGISSPGFKGMLGELITTEISRHIMEQRNNNGQQQGTLGEIFHTFQQLTKSHAVRFHDYLSRKQVD
jgi:hypothetical protein